VNDHRRIGDRLLRFRRDLSLGGRSDGGGLGLDSRSR
jgi:hypothetical protein